MFWWPNPFATFFHSSLFGHFVPSTAQTSHRSSSCFFLRQPSGLSFAILPPFNEHCLQAVFPPGLFPEHLLNALCGLLRSIRLSSYFVDFDKLKPNRVNEQVGHTELGRAHHGQGEHLCSHSIVLKRHAHCAHDMIE